MRKRVAMSKFFLARPVFAWVIAIGIMVLGGLSIYFLPISQYPPIAPPSIAIQAFCARSIFTDDPDHRVPIEKPETYEQHLPDYLPIDRRQPP